MKLSKNCLLGEMDDDLGPQPELWKYSIASSFLPEQEHRLIFTLDMPSPDAFIQVSKGKYF